MRIKRFNENFERIVPQRKLSRSFKKTADLVIGEIENNESLNYLIDIAQQLRFPDFEDGGPNDPEKIARKDFRKELEQCFPEINFLTREFLKTGPEIPFYGRMGSLGVGGNPAEDVVMLDYIIQKLGGYNE